MSRKYLARYKKSPWDKPREVKIKSNKRGEIDYSDLKKKINGGYLCSVIKYKSKRS